jgi:hypothetical protein
MNLKYAASTLPPENLIPSTMQTPKTIARITGCLFLIPLVAYGFGNAFISAVIDAPEPFGAISQNHYQFISGGLLLVINSVTVLAIAVMLFPILEKESRRTALWYLGTRLMEAVILIMGLIGLFLLITLSARGTKTGVADVDVLYHLAKASNYWAYQIAMIILGLGSIPFCLVLYRAKLIPKALSVMGLLGYALLALGAVLELFGYPVGVMLSIPGGLFEIGFGAWLIVKGFS